METSANSGPEPRWAFGRKRALAAAAFSLVEIALSLGIMSFALVAIFGLMPLGMTMFKKAMDFSVGSQIAQRVIGDAQQADFDALISNNGTPGDPGKPFVKSPDRWFDDQGEEGQITQTGMIYQVNTRVVSSTNLPAGSSGNGNGVQNIGLATVTIQVANNPGHITLTPDTTTKLWTATSTVPIATFTTYIARNKWTAP